MRRIVLNDDNGKILFEYQIPEGTHMTPGPMLFHREALLEFKMDCDVPDCKNTDHCLLGSMIHHKYEVMGDITRYPMGWRYDGRNKKLYCRECVILFGLVPYYTNDYEAEKGDILTITFHNLSPERIKSLEKDGVKLGYIDKNGYHEEIIKGKVIK